MSRHLSVARPAPRGAGGIARAHRRGARGKACYRQSPTVLVCAVERQNQHLCARPMGQTATPAHFPCVLFHIVQISVLPSTSWVR